MSRRRKQFRRAMIPASFSVNNQPRTLLHDAAFPIRKQLRPQHEHRDGHCWRHGNAKKFIHNRLVHGDILEMAQPRAEI